MIKRHSFFLWALLACIVCCFELGVASTSHQQRSESGASLRGRATAERQLITSNAKCNCNSCTAGVLSSNADGHTCGNRIDWVIDNMNLSEFEACSLVGGDEFPSICGGCDPNKCSDTTNEQVSEPSQFACGCSRCTTEIWSTLAGEYTCGGRITWLQNQKELDEATACRTVSEEFPEICKCHPDKCIETTDFPTLSPTTPPTTSSPTTNVPTSSPTIPPTTSSPTDYPTTEAPTSFPTTSSPTDYPTTETPTSSPTTSSPTDYPTTEGPTSSPTTPPTTSSSSMCGCDSCTDQVLSSVAEGHSCRDRINWVIANREFSEPESCKTVADEYPDICGQCHSDYCGNSPPTSQPISGGATVSVMSYNTEYTGYSDGRVPYFAAKIVEVSPDVVGLQECQDPNALADATGYALLKATGPQNYILYNANRLQEIDRGSMNIPRDDYAQRAITWGKFQIIQGDGYGSEFWFFNTHLPHRHNQASDPNTHARIGRSLLDKREELGGANTPTIVVGDCNPFASSGASEGSFESNLASGGIVKVYEAKGNTGGYGGLDKIFASQEHWTTLNAADRGTGRSDHPAIEAWMSLN